MPDIVKLLVSARKSAGLTQEQLSELTGIARPNIARLESGKYPPNIVSLERIAKALGKELVITLK
mgnify:CR=1 FL=1